MPKTPSEKPVSPPLRPRPADGSLLPEDVLRPATDLELLRALRDLDHELRRRKTVVEPVNTDDDENDRELEEEFDDVGEDFPPDGRFDGIPRNWMGEPC